MQPAGYFNIQCGLVFMKFLFVQICNGFLVGASQKNHLLRLENEKWIFLCKGKINPQHQHCSTSQYAHMCIRWGHMNKLCHGSGHDLAHLA